MLLEAGELGKEMAIQLQRLGAGVIAVDRFGASAPAEVMYENFGTTTEAFVKAAEARL